MVPKCGELLLKLEISLGNVRFNMKKALSFDDVLCIPKYSEVKSRKDVSLSVKWEDLEFPSMILAANMPTVVDLQSAIEMSKYGVTPVLHREQGGLDVCQQIALFKKESPNAKIAASIGINKEEYSNISDYFSYGADFVVLDVAHANHKMVYDFVKCIFEQFPNRKFVIGNFATAPTELLKAVGNHKNFAWKIGVGSGANCSTRIKTGHGIPTLSSLMWIRHEYPNLFLIADGGMKHPGDICKALAAGADMVMLGSMLAATKQSPGPTIRANDGLLYKVHAGNASYSTKYNSGRDTKYIEGIESLIRVKGDMKDVISDIFDGVQSGFSYSGATNVSEFKKNAELVEVTHFGYVEGTPHILNKS